MSPVRIVLLQAFRVTVAGRAAAFRSRKAAALLAYLAAEPRPQQRTTLAGLLWPDQPQAAALHNLSQTLIYLRQAIQDPADLTDRLLNTRHTVALRPATDDWIDLAAIDLQLAIARQAPHMSPDHIGCARCDAALETAAELYTGPFLADFSLPDSDLFEEWALQRRERLQREIVTGLERLAASYAAQQAHERVQSVARRLLELDPLREATHRLLMRALSQTGQRAAALAQYAECRRLLASELGIEPDLETSALAAQIRADAQASAALATPWNTAPRPGPVYGRQTELGVLSGWLRASETRVVALLGMGGIGKTTLAAKVAESVAGAFTHVLWRSVLNAPPLSDVIQRWCQALGAAPPAPSAAPEAQLDALFDALGDRRCLLVLDNLESLLAAGTRTGDYRSALAGYAALIRRFAEGRQSARLLLTSRERPRDLARLERAGSAVRTLTVSGLAAQAVQAILTEEGLDDAWAASATLAGRYSGNPLAIRLVADTIRELFRGDVTAFVRGAPPIFTDIRDLLDQQLARVTAPEREVLTWLALAREPLSVTALGTLLAERTPQHNALESIGALRRRSLLETRAGTVGLQHVVLEYLTVEVIRAVAVELEGGELDLLHRFALLRPQTHEYIRQTQADLIVRPVAEQLLAGHGQAGTEALLRRRLAALADHLRPGYAAGNLVNLLLTLQADLRGLNCAGLSVWHADLRGALLHDASFASADLRGSVFTDAFRAVPAVAYSPDGSLLAAGTSDGSIRLWHPDGQLAHLCHGHTALVWAVVFSPDGSLLASAAMDRTVRLWQVSSGTLLRTWDEAAAGVVALAFSPDGSVVAAAGFDPTIRRWDVRTGARLATLPGHQGATLGLTFAPDGKTLVSGGLDHQIRIWDVASGAEQHAFVAHADTVLRVVFSPDGALLASSSHDRSVRLWDAQTYALRTVFESHTDAVTGCAWSPDGGTLASVSWDRRVILWDVASGAPRAQLHGHTTHIGAVCYRPDGATLASGGFDQTVRVWDAQDGRLLTVLRGHTAWVWAVAFSPDGATLASAHQDGTACTWEPRGGSLRSSWRVSSGEVSTLAWLPDGALVTGGRDRVVRRWAAGGGVALYEHAASLCAVAVQPGTAQIASASFDGAVRLWDPAQQADTALTSGQTHSALPLAFSPDGALLALADASHGVQLWDVQRRQLVSQLVGHTQTVLALVWSLDGGLIASAGQDGGVRLWHAPSGALLQSLPATGGWIFALAFSPDGGVLAGGSDDGSVYLWDTASGALRAALPGHRGWVFSLAFHPDGTLLASGSDDGTVRVWDPQDLRCLHVLAPPGPYAGMDITGASGLTRAQRAALVVLGARG